jgi:hypothetical protein
MTDTTSWGGYLHHPLSWDYRPEGPYWLFMWTQGSMTTLDNLAIEEAIGEVASLLPLPEGWYLAVRDDTQTGILVLDRTGRFSDKFLIGGCRRAFEVLAAEHADQIAVLDLELEARLDYDEEGELKKEYMP